MSEKIRNFVISAIEKKGKLPKDCDIDSFNYIDSGYVDSMGIIKFMISIEAEFNIELTESNMESPEFKTIGGLVGIIKNKIA
ncbi:phosphopantetheine-binding protein [Candidatus Halobeggiatoa sp. HSG11]|nr:phosphopantetheine-binding protein [Candidatus Halobeggiatoa sp. HSG11]